MTTVAQIREHYDSLALIYRTFWGDHIHHGLFTDHESPEIAQVRLLDYCVRLLELRGGEIVLDAGCGHGGTLLYLSRRFGCRGKGLTISPKQGRIARENALQAHLADRLEFIVEDVGCFRFPAEAFDIIWAMESSEHFGDKARFFCNAASSLRAGGQLLLAAWTGSMQSHRVRDVARSFLCPQLWTAEEYKSSIEAAGLQLIHDRNLTAQVTPTWTVCQKRVRFAQPTIKLLPRAAREFVQGIDVILDAYRSGELTYTVMIAQKPLVTCAMPS
ncbi:MAG TPA: class I SAM-dependent methyltransferase [Terriglobales bacterium]|nr:class I SAM-dependent methyltransferase [Terriglobales bacterium]